MKPLTRKGASYPSVQQIRQLQIESDSLISYLRQRQSGERNYKSLIHKRIAAIRSWLNSIEAELTEEG